MNQTPTFLDAPVERVMTSRPDTVGPEESLGDAAGLMVSGGYRHLPVVDPDGRLVGVLSERDLRARLGSELEGFPDAGRQLLADTVESAMRPDPLRVGRNARLREVLEILIDDRVGALPVTEDDDRLVGIVSYVDLLAYLREGPPAPVSAKPTRHVAPARAKPGKRAAAQSRPSRGARGAPTPSVHARRTPRKRR